MIIILVFLRTNTDSEMWDWRRFIKPSLILFLNITIDLNIDDKITNKRQIQLIQSLDQLANLSVNEQLVTQQKFNTDQ